MRQWLPQGWLPHRTAVAGLVAQPCVRHCELAWPVEQFFGPNPRVTLVHADADEVPWLGVARGRPPEPPRTPAPGEASQLHVAVCLAGQVRTLVHPAVWQSLSEHVLEGRRHDLFAVLGVGSSKRSALPPQVRAETGAWEDRAPEACALEVALSALRPVAVRFVTAEKDISPCHGSRRDRTAAFASLQFAKWGMCAELIGAHEAERGRR